MGRVRADGDARIGVDLGPAAVADGGGRCHAVPCVGRRLPRTAGHQSTVAVGTWHGGDSRKGGVLGGHRRRRVQSRRPNKSSTTPDGCRCFPGATVLDRDSWTTGPWRAVLAAPNKWPRRGPSWANGCRRAARRGRGVAGGHYRSACPVHWRYLIRATRATRMVASQPARASDDEVVAVEYVAEWNPVPKRGGGSRPPFKPHLPLASPVGHVQ